MMRSDHKAVDMDRLRALGPALQAAGLGPVEHEVPMAREARWQIGGRAALLVRPRSTDQVAGILRLAQGVPVCVMGDGSNMLFDSLGFDGLVIRVGAGLNAMRINGNRVICGAGVWVPRLALELSRKGLRGLEHVVGIPGRLGGLVMMNGGSQRKGIGSHVRRVQAVTRDGRILVLDRASLDRAPSDGVAYDGPMALARSELISFSARLAG